MILRFCIWLFQHSSFLTSRIFWKALYKIVCWADDIDILMLGPQKMLFQGGIADLWVSFRCLNLKNANCYQSFCMCPAVINLFKVENRNTRTKYEIYPKIWCFHCWLWTRNVWWALSENTVLLIGIFEISEKPLVLVNILR